MSDLKQKWKICAQSICLIEHYFNDEVIGQGTGFKLGKNIITNYHVLDYRPLKDKYSYTKISFKKSDGVADAITKQYNSSELTKVILTSDVSDGWDYSILYDSDFDTIPGLIAEENQEKIEIGQRAFFLGFPLQSKSLRIGNSYISGFDKINKVDYIHIDASINSGNSGGPLINFDNDKVLGYITRKHTGFSQKFKELQDGLKYNILILKNLENSNTTISFNGINYLSSLEIIQNQIKELSAEVDRSSNVGIGIAFRLTEINRAIEELESTEQ